MNNFKKLLFLVFMVLSLNCFPQVESFIRTYGIDGFNHGRRLAVLSDTTYMILGNKSGPGGMNNVYMIHVNETGQIIKDQVFGGTDLVFASDMAVQGDTLFVITGYILNTSTQEYDVITFWIDKDLNPLREVQFNAPGWNLGKAACINISGDVFVACETQITGQRPCMLLLHYDQNGILLNELQISEQYADIIPEAMIIINDTSLYIAGGYTPDPDPGQGLILHVSTGFLMIDTLLFNVDTLNIHYNDIELIDADKIAATGYHTVFESPVKRLLFHSFDYELTQTVDTRDYTNGSYCNCIASSPEKFSAIGCHTTAFGSGNADFHYIRYNNSDFLGASTIGGLMYDEPFDIAFALDSSLVMIGTTESFGTPITSIMFAKTCKDYFYCVDDNQHFTNISEPDIRSTLTVFPNPAHDYITLSSDIFVRQSIISVTVLSTEGRLVLKKEFINPQREIIIDVSSLSKGLYVLFAETKSEQARIKFIKY